MLGLSESLVYFNIGLHGKCQDFKNSLMSLLVPCFIWFNILFVVLCYRKYDHFGAIHPVLNAILKNGGSIDGKLMCGGDVVILPIMDSESGTMDDPWRRSALFQIKACEMLSNGLTSPESVLSKLCRVSRIIFCTSQKFLFHCQHQTLSEW